MERRLFLSTFLYSEVLVALNTCKFSQSIAIFVENLRTRPKRKKTDVIAWNKQTQLAILHNNKVYQRNALQQLNFPSKPLKTNFFNFLSQHSIELTPHQKKNILTNPLRSITLLFAHKMNLIYLFPKQLQYLHRHLPEQQHPLYCIVSASTNDLNDENFRKLITNLSGNQMSTFGEGDSIIEGVGDGMEVDVGIEGEGKGQKKRKSNKTRKNNSKEYGVKEVLVWEGKKKKYGFIWEGAKYANELYWYKRKDLQGALEKVVEFWNAYCVEVWDVGFKEKLVKNIHSQDKKMEEEGKKEIEKIEEEKWKVVEWAICPVEEKRKRLTRVSRVVRKNVIFYQIKYQNNEG